MANNENHSSKAPAETGERQPTGARTGDVSREFWDTVQSTFAQPAPRAIWVLIGALCVCAALITSAAAFATVYFL